MTPTLSLVIPVYNVAAFLPACLDSLVAQTRQPDEIVCIDDGATDDCPAILASYSDRLPQMRVIRQTNGGLSAARNTGLVHASGDWLMFLDSDDHVDPRYCETAMALAADDDLDIGLFNGWFDFEGRHPEAAIYPDEPGTAVMSGGSWLLDRLTRRKFFHFVWLHIYRRSFIEQHGLRFVAPWIHEDVPWTSRALCLTDRVRYIPAQLVHYRKSLRPNAPGPKQDAKLRLLIDSSVFNAFSLDRLFGQLSDHRLAAAIAWQLVDGGLSVFHHLAKIDSRPELRRLRRQLRSQGFFALLWRHATTAAQRRRITRNWLKSFF